MEVLFEYRGSRRQLTASSGENLVECITTELQRIGRSRAQVFTANVDLSNVDRNREVYLLQKWSPQWDCYVDVNQASEISDGDKLAVVIKPKPPPKFLLLCCWCSGVQNEPQVQGVPRSKKNAVRKNEEIQALDFVMTVESSRQSRTSEWAESESLAPSESKETDLNEGEQYVRAESGRASWKLVPTKSSEELATTGEDDQLQPQPERGDQCELAEDPGARDKTSDTQESEEPVAVEEGEEGVGDGEEQEQAVNDTEVEKNDGDDSEDGGESKQEASEEPIPIAQEDDVVDGNDGGSVDDIKDTEETVGVDEPEQQLASGGDEVKVEGDVKDENELQDS